MIEKERVEGYPEIIAIVPAPAREAFLPASGGVLEMQAARNAAGD